MSRLYDILAQLVKADRRTLLWTNPSPTAAFSPTTVAVNLSGYDAVEVAFKDHKSATAGQVVRCMKGGNTISLQNSGSGAYIRWRWFQPQSDNSGVKFLDGYQGTTVNNDYATPYQIWGVKWGGLKSLILNAFHLHRLEVAA